MGGILQGAEKCLRAHPGEEAAGHTRRSPLVQRHAQKVPERVR